MEDGTPVKGATIRVEPITEGRKPLRGKTDKRGEETFPFVQFGEYQFRVEDDDLLMIRMEILVEQRGNKYEYDDSVEMGPDQAVPQYQIGPGREVTLTVTMVPKDHFAGMLAIAGEAKLNKKLEEANGALMPRFSKRRTTRRAPTTCSVSPRLARAI